MAAVASPLLRAGPAPHHRGVLDRRTIALASLIALAPAIAASVAVFGWAAIGRVALGAGLAVLVEWGAQRAYRQPIRVGDFEAMLQGTLLALLLPPTVPWWMLLTGVVFMIAVAKQIYGGAGAYPFNPVLIGWAVLLLSWGNRVYPIGGELLGTAWTPAVAFGGVALVLLGHVDWEMPLGVLLGVVVAAFLFLAAGADIRPWAEQLTTGSVLLGAFFLATDKTCSPANRWPRLLDGLLAGVLIVLLRHWGVWPEPVPFALLLANAAAPLLDKLRPRPRRRLVRHA